MYHNCAGYSVNGVVGSKNVWVGWRTDAEQGYNTITTEEEFAGKGAWVGHYTWEEVEKTTNMTFNTVLFDCEGCYLKVVKENIDKFKAVDKVILEYDFPTSSKNSWTSTLATLRILEAEGLEIVGDQACMNNIKNTYIHTLACHYILLRKTKTLSQKL